MEYINMQMELTIVENGKIISIMGRDNMNFQTGPVTLEIGKIISCMGLVTSSMSMVESGMDSLEKASINPNSKKN